MHTHNRNTKHSYRGKEGKASRMSDYNQLPLSPHGQSPQPILILDSTTNMHTHAHTHREACRHVQPILHPHHNHPSSSHCLIPTALRLCAGLGDTHLTLPISLTHSHYWCVWRAPVAGLPKAQMKASAWGSEYQGSMNCRADWIQGYNLYCQQGSQFVLDETLPTTQTHSQTRTQTHERRPNVWFVWLNNT